MIGFVPVRSEDELAELNSHEDIKLLGYRALFTQDMPADVALDVVRDETLLWLKEKFDEDIEVPLSNQTVLAINDKTQFHSTTAVDERGGNVQRYTLTEILPTGQWQTTITIGEKRADHNRPWVLIDVDAPAEKSSNLVRWVGAPRIVRKIIERQKSYDNGIRLTTGALLIHPQKVNELVSLLKNQGRRTLSFVAGSSLELPMQPWKELIGSLLQQSVGQASGYVLDPSATKLFNAIMGDHFGVAPGMLRTYLPELDVTEPSEALKHRFLTAQSLTAQPVPRLRASLSHRAREISGHVLLPESIRAAVRTLDALEFNTETGPLLSRNAESQLQILRDQQAKHPRPILGSKPEPSAEAAKIPETETPQVEIGTSSQSLISAKIVESIKNITGLTLDSSDQVAIIEEMLRDGQRLPVQAERWDQRFRSIQDELEEKFQATAALRSLTEDLQIESAELWEDYTVESEKIDKANRLINHLRGIIVATGKKDTYYDESKPKSSLNILAPGSFNEFPSRIQQLSRIELTANPDTMAGLDQYDDLSDWSKKTWSILVALNNYAELSMDNKFPMGVQSFLENPPEGYRSFPPGRHARDESESVKSNPKYRNPRILPCPEAVNTSGRVFMPAHFRIAKFGIVSPRLHYFDAVSDYGKVIVGYIGPHLPNTMTN